MNTVRVLRTITWGLTFAVLVVAVIASITHGDIQEFCATAIYVGAVFCVVLLAIERVVERRGGGYAD